MADDHPTISDQQLALFKEHVSLQREELAEQRQKNRADEAIETRRITADLEVHEKNITHAGKVLEAQAQDRKEVRDFWSKQLQWVFIVLILLIFVSSLIAGYAIHKNQSKEVFDMITKIVSYAVTFLAGIGMDRAWINRKKPGLTSLDPKE